MPEKGVHAREAYSCLRRVWSVARGSSENPGGPLGEQHYILKSPPLPEGKTDLRFSFTRTKEFGGEGELYINGKKVDEVDMPQMHIATYSLAETIDVGRDTGTQVSGLYNGIFEFNARLDRVIFTISDESTVPPRKLPAMYY